MNLAFTACVISPDFTIKVPTLPSCSIYIQGEHLALLLRQIVP